MCTPLFLSWQSRSIVQESLPSLADGSFMTIKENIQTAHSQDIPPHSRTAASGENPILKLGSLPCELVLLTHLNSPPSSESRCAPPQTTCTPHTQSTTHESPLTQQTNSSSSSPSPPVSNGGTAQYSDCSVTSFTQSPSVSPANLSAPCQSDSVRPTVGKVTAQNMSFTRKYQVRHKWTNRRPRNKVEERVHSEPEQSGHEHSLSEPSLDISTSSLPSDLLSQSTVRLTRSKAALLKQRGLSELISLRELPTERRKTRDECVGNDTQCSESESDNREEALNGRQGADVSECAAVPCNKSTKIKSSSPSYPSFVECTTTPSPYASQQPAPEVRVFSSSKTDTQGSTLSLVDSNKVHNCRQ